MLLRSRSRSRTSPAPRRGALGLFLLAALLAIPALQAVAADPPPKAKGKPNRLAKESSPYLLQHAHNPVDWYPWGPEAFEKAKKEKKLIFLSIGYSSCHWCHVMERESFENEEVAKVLNANFVCIKVDREERPDIDDIYMTALHVMGGRGGWPLSMFLTADGKPIIGGTYWPREDREVDGQKLRGFKSVLRLILDINKDKPKDVQQQADSIAEQTNEILNRAARGIAIVELNATLVGAITDAIKEEVDPVYGGIGNASRKHKGTKFPMPSAVGLLLQQSKGLRDKELAGMVTLTLDKMATGGIYDQLGGGFHRYSTERTWTVPHFEKMLYDNAQLVELYAEACRAKPNPLYERVIRETLAFVGREMTSPQGAFYSALDADSDGEEGKFYVWTEAEIDKVIGDKADAALFKAAYGGAGAPNFEEKYYILTLKKPLVELAKEQRLPPEQLDKKLAALRAKLFKARAARKRPFLDTKVLTAWNGQMIAGYAVAGQVLKEPAYIDAAKKAADFVLANLRTKDGRLLRAYATGPDGKGVAKLNGYLDDYAFFVHGLLALHDATGEKRWLDEAKVLTDLMVKFYGDGDNGGFFYTSSDHEKLFARAKDYSDGVQPSGNSAAVGNLVRLWRKTGEAKYRTLAQKTFKQFGGALRGNPTGVPAMASALALYLDAAKDKAPAEPKKEGPKGGIPKSESVVKISAKRGKSDGEGVETVLVTLAIDKPWHVYANPVGSKILDAAQTRIEVLSGGKPVEARADYPKGALVKDETVGNYFTYEGTVTIPVRITRAKGDDKPLEVRVRFQACSGSECLLPAVVREPVK